MPLANDRMGIVDKESRIEAFLACILAIHCHQRMPETAAKVVCDRGKAHLRAADIEGWKRVEKEGRFRHGVHENRATLPDDAPTHTREQMRALGRTVGAARGYDGQNCTRPASRRAREEVVDSPVRSAGIEIAVNRLASVEELEPLWSDLEARAESPFFLSWTWIRTWLEVGCVQPLLVVARMNGRVAGLGVLDAARRQRFGFAWPALARHETGREEPD